MCYQCSCDVQRDRSHGSQAACAVQQRKEHGAYALKVHFWLRDALVSMYARATRLQIRASCSAELHGRPGTCAQLNASALHALACHVAHCSGVSKTRGDECQDGRASRSPAGDGSRQALGGKGAAPPPSSAKGRLPEPVAPPHQTYNRKRTPPRAEVARRTIIWRGHTT